MTVKFKLLNSKVKYEVEPIEYYLPLRPLEVSFMMQTVACLNDGSIDTSLLPSMKIEKSSKEEVESNASAYHFSIFYIGKYDLAE